MTKKISESFKRWKCKFCRSTFTRTARLYKHEKSANTKVLHNKQIFNKLDIYECPMHAEHRVFKNLDEMR